MKKILSIILAILMIVTTIPMAFAENEKVYQVGDIVQFGSYPQTEVTDEALIAELNKLAPEWSDWTSYGYYMGTGTLGTMTQGSWMRYTDIKYKGERYRGVKFTEYRPYSTFSPASTQNMNGYITNTVYWFKFEFINWRVLEPQTGLVMCETIIDSQPYSNTVYSNTYTTYGYFNDASYSNYASDYGTSFIRKWLNDDFYNTAFSDDEMKEINITTLVNDGYYTSIGTTGYEKLDSNQTNDKIFLLSYNEAKNNSLGFKSNADDADQNRFGQGSDYAQCQGLYVYRNSDSIYNNNSVWLLRSPSKMSYLSCGVDYDGNSNSSYDVYVTFYGIRPALRFNLNSDKIIDPEHTCSYSSIVTKDPTHIDFGEMTYICKCGKSYTEDIEKIAKHDFKALVTEPTCTQFGYTTYTCECGENFISDFSEPKHKDKNGDYLCDNGCGYEFENTVPDIPNTPDESAKDCSCNCHKSGIVGFFWKLLNFFYKLLRLKKVCACGVAHY